MCYSSPHASKEESEGRKAKEELDALKEENARLKAKQSVKEGEEREKGKEDTAVLYKARVVLSIT